MEKSISIITTVDIPYSRIADLLSAAFEGGVGYWCVIVGYNIPIHPESAWGENRIYRHIDYPLCDGGAVKCKVTESDVELENQEPLILNLVSIHRGFRTMSNKYPRHWNDFISQNEDAITADVFLQCCFFDEVIFG
jgi:hypothetical protein